MVVILLLILASFIVIRVPIMYRQPGGLDEEYYAIPGLTILRTGIPRMPHVPQRDPSQRFYLADQAFFAEPPLSYSWQAAFYAVLPHVYGAARLSSGVAALAGIWLVYELGRKLYHSNVAALWGAGLYSLMRTFYFPAMTARPDMLCTAFGLGALLCVAEWQTARKTSLLIAAGVLLGLGGLTHPLALVYAVQSAVWVFLASRGWRRILRPALLAITALAVFLLWLPLILAFPDAFRSQFFYNIVHPAGPGLLIRLFTPWTYLRYHAWMMAGHLGAIQTALLLGGPAVAVLLDWRSDRPGRRAAWMLAWSSVYLLAVLSGIHPTQYYWCFPTALLCVCLGRAIAAIAERWPVRGRARWALNWTAGVALVAVMLPGAGLRAWIAHVRHWNDINYNAPALARRMLAELPADARYTVDREFALDFFAAGRRTILAETAPYYLRADLWPYDYLILSRHGLDEHMPAAFHAELIRTYGNRDDQFACYAEVYRPARGAD